MESLDGEGESVPCGDRPGARVRDCQLGWWPSPHGAAGVPGRSAEAGGRPGTGDGSGAGHGCAGAAEKGPRKDCTAAPGGGEGAG